MKSVSKLLLGIFLSLSFFANAQLSVNDVNLDSIDVKYIHVFSYTKGLSMKLNVGVDYGQEADMWKSAYEIKDKNGRTKKFNTNMDILNFFTSNGWNYVNETITLQGNIFIFRYLLSKKE